MNIRQILNIILRWLSHDDARIRALEREVAALKRQRGVA